ncbi:MAG: sarcosine oxidase subunit gamma [Albidovulum sp.]
MASLLELTPCDGLLPITIGSVTLGELPPARITSVAPFEGRETAAAKVLRALGLGWPKPGCMVARNDTACLWSGRGQAMLIGAIAEGLDGIAALSDQSDGWARMRIEGNDAEAVLARLVPVDLSRSSFGKDQAARTSLGHMMLLIARTGGQAFDLMVFRSMAHSAVHELEVAMKSVAARANTA